MKRIEILQTFKHGGQTFHAGEVRLVSPEDAGYFCGLGWAKAEGIATGTPDTSEKTLEVQNVTFGHAAQSPGVK
jgi:hypothetical protein